MNKDLERYDRGDKAHTAEGPSEEPTDVYVKSTSLEQVERLTLDEWFKRYSAKLEEIFEGWPAPLKQWNYPGVRETLTDWQDDPEGAAQRVLQWELEGADIRGEFKPYDA